VSAASEARIFSVTDMSPDLTSVSSAVAAYAQTPVTLSTLSNLTSLSARPVAVQSQPISVTKVFPPGLGMVGSVGMNVGVTEVSLPVHTMQAVQAANATTAQTPGQPSQTTSVYIQAAPHRGSPGKSETTHLGNAFGLTVACDREGALRHGKLFIGRSEASLLLGKIRLGSFLVELGFM